MIQAPGLVKIVWNAHILCLFFTKVRKVILSTLTEIVRASIECEMVHVVLVRVRDETKSIGGHFRFRQRDCSAQVDFFSVGDGR